MTKEIGSNGLIETWASAGTVVEPSVGKVAGGWEFEEQPPHEYMNWIANYLGQKINHLMRSGVPTWNEQTPHIVGDVVAHSSGLWIALEGSTGSEPAGGNTDWIKIPDLTDISSQSEAIAGLSNSKLMTPQRVKDVIDSLPDFVTDPQLNSALNDYLPLTGGTLNGFVANSFGSMALDAPAGQDAVFLWRDESGVRQGAVFWDRNTDTFKIRRYNSDPNSNGADGEIEIRSDGLSYNGDEIWHDGNDAPLRNAGSLNAGTIPAGRIASHFGNDLATEGYQRLPGGLILQWGTATDTGSPHPFPIAFPTACLSAMTTDNIDSDRNVITVSFTRQNISFSASDNSFWYWWAIGY